MAAPHYKTPSSQYSALNLRVSPGRVQLWMEERRRRAGQGDSFTGSSECKVNSEVNFIMYYLPAESELNTYTTFMGLARSTLTFIYNHNSYNHVAVWEIIIYCIYVRRLSLVLRFLLLVVAVMICSLYCH